MLNKKLIKIISLDDLGEGIIIFGQFCHEDIQKIINIAETHNMACLGFIDLCSDTYFNKKQCMVIKNELEIISTHNDLNKNLLETLYVAIEYSIETGYCIKIESY